MDWLTISLASFIVLLPLAASADPLEHGRVLADQAGDVVIDLGSNHGLSQGDSVAFELTQTLPLQKVGKTRQVALGQVVALSPDQAVVEVGFNVDIPDHASVRITDQPFESSIWAPERAVGTEVAATLRPFIPLETLGAGGVVDLWATYRFDAPLALTAAVSPVGFAITNDVSEAVFAAHGIVSYDARLFQIGLGLGTARIENPDLPYELVDVAEPAAMTTGVSTAQHLRIGARDGLSFTATTFFVAAEQFEFGGMTGELQVPFHYVIDDAWLIARGGGLRGFGYGELGLRTLLSGNGTSGSVFVTPTLGAAGMSTNDYEICAFADTGKCRTSDDFAGPTVGVTLEWRP